MCGICGIYLRKQGLVHENILYAMADSIQHRGPDKGDVWIHGNVGLGHRRLSIIDREGGGQPMFNETRDIAIVFNGEIYNHHDLRADLLSKGHIFQSKCDTEAIIHLYEQYDLNFVRYLRGMFAFAIWDNRHHRLVMARDRVGIKPLLYADNPQGLFFGSEMKAILAAGISRTISTRAVSDFLTYRYVPAPETIFEEVKRLLPGHLLVADEEKIRVFPYWDLDCTAECTDSPTMIQQNIRQLLQESVSSHLESEVPLGAFLSGGVDSSAVVSLMAGVMSNPVQTYTIGFKDKNFDESDYAQRIATRYHTKHYPTIISNPEPNELDSLLAYFDEPFADSSSIPTYLICREAAKNITVVLSGDGGDENFGGYRRYYYDIMENHIRSKIPNFLRQWCIRPLAKLYPKADWLPQIFRAKTLLTNICRSPAEAYHASLASVPEFIKNQILHPDILQALEGYRSIEKFLQYYNQTTCSDLFRKISYTDFKMYLCGDILTKVDLASMAHSLEVRVPILDHKVIEYAFSIPTKLKINKSGGKDILKKSVSDLVDHDILYRKKMGFSVPLANWLRHDLSIPFAERVLHGKHLPYFNYDTIQHLYRRHLSGMENHQESLWNIWVFHRWYDTWGLA